VQLDFEGHEFKGQGRRDVFWRQHTHRQLAAVKYHLHRVSKNIAENPTTLSRVTAKNVGHVF